MAIQLQIRRGTAAENDVFTGAVGELTMDTDTNGLRIHNGTTVGGIKIPTTQTTDYVVEWQVPTDLNGYTWYRKYASGWVEQGCGLTQQESSTVVSHTLPVEMANANYTVVITGNRPTSTTGGYSTGVDEVTTTGFKTRGSTNGASTSNTYSWYVAGMAA